MITVVVSNCHATLKAQESSCATSLNIYSIIIYSSFRKTSSKTTEVVSKNELLYIVSEHMLAHLKVLTKNIKVYVSKMCLSSSLIQGEASSKGDGSR